MNAILPFLNKFVPIGLAMKGIEKISPKMGKFLTSAAGAGYATDTIFDFLRNKIENPNYIDEKNRLEQGSQQGSLRPDEAASLKRVQQGEAIPNAIGKGLSVAAGALGGLSSLGGSQQGQSAQQGQPQEGFDPLSGLNEFPELIQFIQSEQQSGGNAQSIASKARKSVKLRTFVNAIEQKVGQPFENVLAQLIGQSQPQGQQQQQGAPGQGKGQFLQGLNSLGQMLQSLKG